jgi:hypothetical protein
MDEGLLSFPVVRLTYEISWLSSSEGEDQADCAEADLVGLSDTGLGKGVGVGVGVDAGEGVENTGKAETKVDDIGGGKCRWRIRSRLAYARRMGAGLVK